MPVDANAAKAIFMAALDKSDPAERAAYVAQACGNDHALWERVEILLKANDDPGSFLNSPLADPTPDVEATEDEPMRVGFGTMIGAYKLLEQIGEGGFGVVYLAEQTQPVRRHVALKLLKPGMDTRQVVARFEAERQALALMDHPNIAKVLDAGATASERPYFVMELVKGLPLTDYCDQNQLTPRGRLDLFLPVCAAVQHAHQKGIIHRDLKPSNVLVASHDGTPVVKIIDFGVAKAIGQQLTDKTVYTQFAQLIGTPLYMSPEQAGHSSLDIDTRSDIYSLGVLLYELLTGTTPLQRKRLQEAALLEVLRLIREEDPPKPSTRLSTTDELPSIAANRGLEPNKLTGLVRGELDWIVMKALEKDRNHRYESANSLGQDVERYLHDEPVQACPLSAWYRLRKFVRRNKGLVLAAGLLLVVLIGGILATTWQAVRATGAQALAEENERQARAERDDKDEALQREKEFAYLRRIALINQRLAAYDMGQVEALLKECPLELRNWEWGYLNSWFRGTQFIDLDLRTTPSEAWSVAFSPDGNQLAAALRSGCVKIWDVATGQVVRNLYSDSWPASVTFSSDGHLLASAEMDGAIKIWDAAAGRLIRTLRAHKVRAQEARFSPDGRFLASAGNDAMVKLWDVASGKDIRTFSGHEGFIFDLAYSRDGKRLATPSLDGTVKLWDVETGTELRTFRGHQGAPLCVAFSPDGTRVASGGYDMSVKIWDPDTGFVERSLDLYSDRVRTVSFSPDGKRLAVAGDYAVIKIVDVASGLELVKLEGHTGNIRRVVFSPDGRRLASASFDKTVKIYDATPPVDKFRFEIRAFREHSGQVYGVAISPDGARLASAGGEGTIYLWDVHTGQVVHRMTSPEGMVLAVAFSTDSRQLASAGSDKKVRLWDVASGKGTHIFSTPSWMEDVTFLPGGNVLAACGVDLDRKHGILLWNAATRQRIDTHFEGSEGELKCLAYSPDGRLIAASTPTGNGGLFRVRLWDAETGQVHDTLPEEDITLYRVAFSPDGRLLATCTGTPVTVWDRQTRKVLHRFAHKQDICCAAFHPDGKRLASADFEGTIKLWDVRTGRELRTYRGHSSSVTGLVFSPDGQWFVTSSWDRTVRIWDAGLTAREWHGPAARRFVQAHFERLFFREDVLARIRADKDIPDEIRPVALELAQEWEEDPNLIARVSYDLVKVPNGKPESYALALRGYEFATHLVPGHGGFLGGLGLAQYRARKYRDAIVTLREAERLLDTQYPERGCSPGILAIQAMAHFRLNQTDEARTQVGRFRERMKHPFWMRDDDAKGFVQEAEQLIERPVNAKESKR
jgi:WD40 repeat protein/serine/threonine protein kinase